VTLPPVVDILGGFVTLVRRTPTLGGSVPLRAAQACVPLLEGNAWGFQITLSTRLALRKRLGQWSAAGNEAGIVALDAMLRGGLPMLGDLVPRAWRKRLAAGVVDAGIRAGPRRAALSVFTGLFVKPPIGWRFRQSATANRRSYAYDIEEAILDDHTGYVPIVLDVSPRADAFVLDGEVATLALLPGALSIARATLAEAPDVVAAHVGFYDGAYFDTKRRGTISRKYREAVREAGRPRAAEPASPDPLSVTVVEAGPLVVAPAAPGRVHRTTGVETPALPPDRLVVSNAVAFEATFDGSHVIVEPDRAELEQFGARVREVWGGIACHQGALLYLTKYFTPHPPGEPHFFTKPPVFVKTAPGVSTVIEGRHGAGYDVLRGVVRTDTFHATPQVFHLWQPNRTITVERGAVLAELFPAPRVDHALAIERAGAAAI